MNLITHDWNGSAIAQLAEDTRIAKYDVPTSYVNATQMCKACGKAWADYAKIDSTKAYWEALSADMNLCISALVISIRGGNNKQIQGTWVHPEIAIDLAQWVSVEFRIWANRTLKKAIQDLSTQPQETQNLPYKVEQPPIPKLPPAPPTPQEISDIVDLVLRDSQIHENLKLQIKAKAIAKQHQEHAVTIDTMLGELLIPIEDELLTPTRLAEILSDRTNTTYTARQINKLLLEQDFQIKNPPGDPDYLPTVKGKPHSQIILNTARGHNRTVHHLRWFKSVLEALEVNDH